MTTMRNDNAVNSDHYIINGKRYVRVSRVLEYCGLTDWTKIPARDREWYMTRGSQCHKAWELIELHGPDSYEFDPVVQQYLSAHAKFLRDTGFKAVKGGIEKRVHSDELRIAGRLDRLGMIQGRLAILDYKTTALVPATRYQTAMYALMLPFAFHEIERYAVAFRKDGTYVMSPKFPLSDKREALFYIDKYHKEHTNGNS